MKRSQINQALANARLAFERHSWHLPPNPRWDVTGFGLGDFDKHGLVLLNLAELPQYCEKLMYAKANQLTVMHTHRKKQEDIIARVGTFGIRLCGRTGDWKPDRNGGTVRVLLNGEERKVPSNSVLHISQGERITLFPGVFHEFWAVSDYCILGEVSTENDDVHDNVFEDPEVGRFEELVEDEPAMFKLVSDK
jgi:D-lyxose ketol-isomerase